MPVAVNPVRFIEAISDGEVGELDSFGLAGGGLGEHDVGGFDVAVQHVGGVGEVACLSGLGDDPHSARRRHGTLA
jgi:hypothetical protein